MQTFSFTNKLPHLLEILESSNTLCQTNGTHRQPSTPLREEKQQEGKTTGEDGLPLATEQREEE